MTFNRFLPGHDLHVGGIPAEDPPDNPGVHERNLAVGIQECPIHDIGRMGAVPLVVGGQIVSAGQCGAGVHVEQDLVGKESGVVLFTEKLSRHILQQDVPFELGGARRVDIEDHAALTAVTLDDQILAVPGGDGGDIEQVTSKANSSARCQDRRNKDPSTMRYCLRLFGQVLPLFLSRGRHPEPPRNLVISD